MSVESALSGISRSTKDLPLDVLDDPIRNANGDSLTTPIDFGGGGEIDRNTGSSSNVRFASVDYAAIPASLVSEETFVGRIDTCEGECSFLITFGNQSVLVSRDTVGYLTEAIVIPRSKQIEGSMLSIDIETQGIDIQRFPIVRISNRVFAFMKSRDGTSVIIPGSVSPKTAAMGGGSFNPGENCTTTRIQKDIKCTDQGDTYYIEWTECDQDVCLGLVTATYNCQAHSHTLPKNVAHAVFGYGRQNCE